MSDLSAIWKAAELVSVDDIAAMWKCERDYARDVLVKLEGFPAPAPGSTRKFQRWRKTEVLEFISGNPA